MLSTNKLYLLCGNSRSGKSHCCAYLIQKFLDSKQLKFGVVFSRTAELSEQWSFLEKKCFIPKWSPEALDAYLDALKAYKKAHGSIPNNFIVFDDMVGLISMDKSTWINFIATYRHYNCTVFITSQSLAKLSPLTREQASYVFLYKHNTARLLKMAYDCFGAQSFEKLQDFVGFLKEYNAEQYQAVVWMEEAEEGKDTKYLLFKAGMPSTTKKYKF